MGLIKTGRRGHAAVVGRFPLGAHRGGHVVKTGDIGRSQRVDGDNRVEERLIAVGQRLGAPLLHRGVAGDVEPVEELVIGIELGGEALVDILLALDDTVVVEDAQCCEDVSLVVAALHSNVMLHAPTVVEHLFIPVGVLTIVVVRLQERVGDVAQIFVIGNILRCVEEVGFLAKTLVDCFQRVADMSLAATVGAVSSSDQHHAVTSLGTIDSSRSGILQHLHRLDERRIEVLDVVDLQTINDEQRSVVTIGTVATHTDLGTSTRRTTVDDLHTCDLALQGSTGIGRGEVLDGVAAHRSHGTGQVALFLHTITDDHHIIERPVVFL